LRSVRCPGKERYAELRTGKKGLKDEASNFASSKEKRRETNRRALSRSKAKDSMKDAFSTNLIS